MFLGLVNFYLEDGYSLKIENNSVYQRTDEFCIYVKTQKFGNRMRYLFEIRFIQCKEVAERITRELYNNLRNYFLIHDIPIYYKNIGFGYPIDNGNYYPAITTQHGKENIHIISKELIGKKFDDEVIGYSIYEIKTPIDDFRFITHDIKMERSYKFDCDEVTEIHTLSEKELLAIDIYNLSNYSLDIRISFVLIITAIESIVSEVKYKSDDFRLFLKQINKKVLKKEQIENLVDSELQNTDIFLDFIKSSLGSLGRKSILEKCSALIEEKNYQNNYYNDESSVEFFLKCYDLRSKFVHAGCREYNEIDERKIRLRDLFKSIIGIE